MIRFKVFGFAGKGTTVAAEAPRVETTEAPGLQPAPQGKRVLIVDDDAVFLRATSMKLRSAGYQVVTAQEGSGAIAALGEAPVDAVLMDVNFPPDVCNGGMGSWDGFQTLNWLRGLPAAQGVRFIMVSGSDSPEYRNRSAKLGAVAYLQKPLVESQLLEAISATD